MAYTYNTRRQKHHVGQQGWIEGLALQSPETNEIVAHYFGGLRYALPPIGNLRFRKTVPLPDDYIYGSEQFPGSCVDACNVCPQPLWLLDVPAHITNEDCLQLNVWVPVGSPKPAEGWPVFIFIHGGFLQFAYANKAPGLIAKMYENTPFNAIVVMPHYRLNAFGFLASQELADEAREDGLDSVGNMGFWDQRTAIEWTAKNIGSFGGDASNISVGGYSAGAYSTFHQLSHDLFLPSSQSVIKRAILWSNGSGVQPRGIDQHQQAFDELTTALNIPITAPAAEKLRRLRAQPSEAIVNKLNSLKRSEFRACSDGVFVNKNLISSINTGEFGRRMRTRGVKLLLGDCRDEHFLYRSWRTPSPSYQAVYQRLCGDYSEEVVQKVLKIYSPNEQLPADCQDWVDLFGKVYSSLQVHSLQRGLVNRLVDSGLEVGRDILRYRIEWRAQCVDAGYPTEWQVSHDTDMAIWFQGNGWAEGLSKEEQVVVRPFAKLFADFVAGSGFEMSLPGPNYAMRLNPEGKADTWEDNRWVEGLRVWEAVNGSADPIRADL